MPEVVGSSPAHVNIILHRHLYLFIMFGFFYFSNRVFKLLVQGFSHNGGASGQVGISASNPSQPGQTLRQKCEQCR